MGESHALPRGRRPFLKSNHAISPDIFNRSRGPRRSAVPPHRSPTAVYTPVSGFPTAHCHIIIIPIARIQRFAHRSAVYPTAHQHSPHAAVSYRSSGYPPLSPRANGRSHFSSGGFSSKEIGIRFSLQPYSMSEMDKLMQLTEDLENEFSSSAAREQHQELLRQRTEREELQHAVGEHLWYALNNKEEKQETEEESKEGGPKTEPSEEEEEEGEEKPKEELPSTQPQEKAAPKKEAGAAMYRKYAHLWGRATKEELFEKAVKQMEAVGTNPWASGRPGIGRRHDLPEEEVEALRTEQGLAAACNMTWQERGPAVFDDRPGQTWRGQRLRVGSQGGLQRYANSGGKNREYYRMLARTGRLQPGPNGATVLEHVPDWKIGNKDPPPMKSKASSSGASSSGAASSSGKSKTTEKAGGKGGGKGGKGGSKGGGKKQAKDGGKEGGELGRRDQGTKRDLEG